jgi:hypothetical protein
MKTQEEKNIREFIKQVEEKLPSWLKDKREELKSVLTELEEHIWDKATEIGKGIPDANAVQAAIAEMGAPSAIAREYKRRGTPKVYITEELWPSYTRTLLAAILVIVCVNVISFCIQGITTGLWVEALESLNGIMSGGIWVFVIVSLIFVGLSMEGYLPEDFKSKFLRGKKIPATVPTPEGTPEKSVRFVNVRGEFINGILNVVFGIVLIMIHSIITNPSVEGLEQGLAAYEEFFLYLEVIGIFVIICGITDLGRSFIGNDPRTGIMHQRFRIVSAIATLASVPILVILLVRPELFPLIIIQTGPDSFAISIGTWIAEPGFPAIFMLGIPVEYYSYYQQVIGVIIAITVLSGGVEIYKAVTLKP